MKKNYLQPSAEMGNMETEQMICSSKAITSEWGIDYGGVDEEGTIEPASRRCKIWDEEVLEEDF